MRKNQSKKIVIALALTGILSFQALALAGCGHNNEANKISSENIEYVNSVSDYSGLSLDIPNGWTLKDENKYQSLYLNENKDLAFFTIFELGGNAYYSPTAIINNLSKMFGRTEYNFDVIYSDYFNPVENAVRIIASGVEDSGNFICDIVAVNPFDGVRYYMGTVASPDVYEANIDVVEKVFASFDLTKKSAQIYEMLNEQDRFKNK